MIMVKCANCPLINMDTACPAHTRPHGRFCELMDPDHPDFDPRYAGPIRIIAGLEPPPEQPIVIPHPPPDDGPGFLAKAVGFGKAIITHAVAGFPEVDEETHSARLSACRACEFLDAERMVCVKCSCFLTIKSKWLEQTCPIGKW